MTKARILAKPVMLYDGDCSFCRRWIGKWQGITKDKVVYEAYQETLKNHPQVTERQCRRAVQLIMADGTVFAGAHAAFKVLALAHRYRFLLWSYENLPLASSVAEWAYRFVARHRADLSKLYKPPGSRL